jgi:hypothetical protein
MQDALTKLLQCLVVGRDYADASRLQLRMALMRQGEDYKRSVNQKIVVHTSTCRAGDDDDDNMSIQTSTESSTPQMISLIHPTQRFDSPLGCPISSIFH